MTAASCEARKYGVRSAMPSVTARRQCPDLIFVKPRFEVYKAVSEQIRDIFAEHTPIIEPLSLDEAYLDVTENLQNIPLARGRAAARKKPWCSPFWIDRASPSPWHQPSIGYSASSPQIAYASHFPLRAR